MDMHEARQAVAANVRSLMGRGIDGRRVTQAQLAAVLDLKSQAAVSDRLNGKQAFNLDEMLAISSFFDIEVTELLEGIARPTDAEDAVPAF